MKVAKGKKSLAVMRKPYRMRGNGFSARCTSTNFASPPTPLVPMERGRGEAE
jgi:hypothetical protein